MKDFRVLQASLKDIETVLGWTKAEGWGLGVHDALPYLVGDPTGFFVGYLENQPVGFIAAIRYSSEFGFIGLYLVKPEFRGKGYGIQIWKKGMEHLKGCNVGLDGVPIQQKKYEKSGFKLAYSHIHYLSDVDSRSTWAEELPSDLALQNIQEIPLDLVLKYCDLKFPAHRHKFLTTWFSMPEASGYVALRDQQIQGLGWIRKCQGAYTIAPLFAENPQIARALFLKLSKDAGKNPILIDVPSVNESAVQLANELKLTPAFHALRMYTDNPPPIHQSTIFGVTSMTMG